MLGYGLIARQQLNQPIFPLPVRFVTWNLGCNWLGPTWNESLFNSAFPSKIPGNDRRTNVCPKVSQIANVKIVSYPFVRKFAAENV